MACLQIQFHLIEVMKFWILKSWNNKEYEKRQLVHGSFFYKIYIKLKFESVQQIRDKLADEVKQITKKNQVNISSQVENILGYKRISN